MTRLGIIEINSRCSDMSFQSCESELYVDDKFMGYTPIQLFLPIGDHTYKIVKPGYFPPSHSPQPPPPLTEGIINVKLGLKSALDVDLINSSVTGGIFITCQKKIQQIY